MAELHLRFDREDLKRIVHDEIREKIGPELDEINAALDDLGAASILDALNELKATRAAVARAEQATAEARPEVVWWAHDDSDYDEWDANAMFADEQHAKDYALNAWMESDLTECEEGHVDLATCTECQARRSTYRQRLKWLKPSWGTWWELWLTGGEFDGKDMKTGIEVAPTKLHWAEALAADVPAAAPAALIQEQWGVRHVNGHSIARDEAEARDWAAEATEPVAVIRRTLTTGAWRDADAPAIDATLGQPTPDTSAPKAPAAATEETP